MRARIAGPMVLVVALVASACGGGSSSSAGGGGSKAAPTIEGVTANVHGSKTVSGATSTTIDASNSGSSFFFSPTVLTGKAGQKLTITVKNTGTVPHTFTLADGSVDKTFQPGQSATVSV